MIDALDLLPKQIAAMVAAGATAEVIEAACAVVCRAVRAVICETQETVSCNVSPVSSTERVRAYRLRQKGKQAKREPVSSPVSCVSPPLSLKEVDLFPRESEEGKGCGEGKPEKPSSEKPTPMLDDWKPDPKTWAWAVAKLGEGAALRCLANYRDHCGANAKPMTEAQRQAKFRIWVRNERSRAAEPQPQLPLLSVVSASDAAPRSFVEKGSPAWQAWIATGHKPGPASYSRDRSKEGWWFASEWPPGHDPPMRATG
jgi:hypothetical protein